MLASENSNMNAQTEISNLLAKEYINTVKENRSLYGSYVDNAVAFAPGKETKAMYNLVFDHDSYFPWGKQGGGAPRLDENGKVVTKIRGNLQWNLSKCKE